MKRHVSIRRLKTLGRKKKCSVLHLNVGRAAKETWIGSLPLHGLIAAPRPFPVAPIYSTTSHSRVSLQNGHLVATSLSAASLQYVGTASIAAAAAAVVNAATAATTYYT
jgi:hypothetical protein